MVTNDKSSQIVSPRFSVFPKRFLASAYFVLIAVPLCAADSLSAEAASWPFEPARDTFSPEAAFDMRSLNEDVAGQSGFVRANANGDFVLGDGTPARFWAVTSYVGRDEPFVVKPLGRQDAPDLAHHARWLAKRGVNMVKLLIAIHPDAKKQPEATAFDPNPASLQAAAEFATDPAALLAFLVGPVLTGTNPAIVATKPASLVPWIGLSAGTVRSSTGELELNWKLGRFQLDAPQAQGVAAFFDRSPSVALSTLSMSCKNPYGVVIAVALDGNPLATSRRILVQTGTQSAPTGWRTSAVTLKTKDGREISGHRVDATGKSPWQVESFNGRITLHNPALTHATRLDLNGMPVAPIPLSKEGEGRTFDWPEATLYVLLEAPAS